MEHVLSPLVNDAVCAFLGHPPTCPHGGPIPQVPAAPRAERGEAGGSAAQRPGSRASADRVHHPRGGEAARASGELRRDARHRARAQAEAAVVRGGDRGDDACSWKGKWRPKSTSAARADARHSPEQAPPPAGEGLAPYWWGNPRGSWVRTANPGDRVRRIVLQDCALCTTLWLAYNIACLRVTCPGPVLAIQTARDLLIKETDSVHAI